jgi:poly(A) polymerase
MSDVTHIQGQAWLTASETRAVMTALGDARFVGGCVRNALLGEPVDDIDIATPLSPDEVFKRTRAAGLRPVDTGVEHGTVTVVANSKPFEVTTLRRDVTTDGRRAVVAFTQDWAEDASRRDFTMNALYADVDGKIHDHVGGLADLKVRRVRFIGDPAQRIAEDYLRILRFFRIHAWYGRGDLDAEGLRACAAAKSQLTTLSGERIQKEMLKLLSAREPMLSLGAMAELGVLSVLVAGLVKPERVRALRAVDLAFGTRSDGLLRLGGLLSTLQQARDVAAQWRLSNDQRDRLVGMHSGLDPFGDATPDRDLRPVLYRSGSVAVGDCVRLRWADDSDPAHAAGWHRLLALAESWKRPHMPITGADIMAAGVPQGPKVGRVMSDVEQWWIAQDFVPGRDALLEKMRSAMAALG